MCGSFSNFNHVCGLFSNFDHVCGLFSNFDHVCGLFSNFDHVCGLEMKSDVISTTCVVGFLISTTCVANCPRTHLFLLLARCVANDYFGQTDVSRSSQVCSGGVHRCDVHSLRVHFGRSETGHPRGSTLAHVHTTGRCCSVCIHAKSINSHAHRVTPHSTILCADSRST